MNLATATPAEIDGQLAELYREAGRAEQAVKLALNTLHRVLGERQVGGYGRRSSPCWPTTDEQAVERARHAAADGEVASPMYSQKPVAEFVAKYDTALAEVARVEQLAAPLNDEFARRGGWSRFFVVQNNGGHTHSSMNCSTCNRNGATAFGWNPQLSGLTEAEAVEQLGPSLCTVCFPSAPVEWTLGKPAADKCPGSGKAPVEGTERRYGRKTYGKCTGCPDDADTQIVLGGGRIRAHGPKAT